MSLHSCQGFEMLEYADECLRLWRKTGLPRWLCDALLAERTGLRWLAQANGSL